MCELLIHIASNNEDVTNSALRASLFAPGHVAEICDDGHSWTIHEGGPADADRILVKLPGVTLASMMALLSPDPPLRSKTGALPPHEFIPRARTLTVANWARLDRSAPAIFTVPLALDPLSGLVLDPATGLINPAARPSIEIGVCVVLHVADAAAWLAENTAEMPRVPNPGYAA